MTSKEIGGVLQLCRERKGWSQTELAHRLHMDQSEVSRIENGKADIDLEAAIKWGNTTDSSELIAMIFTGEKAYQRIRMVDALMVQIRSTIQMHDMMA